MKREDIEKAEVADLVREFRRMGTRGMNVKNPEKTTGRKNKTAPVQDRTTNPAKGFYAYSRIGTLILLWVAETPPAIHPATCPHLK
jgi:hypothetical protein